MENKKEQSNGVLIIDFDGTITRNRFAATKKIEQLSELREPDQWRALLQSAKTLGWSVIILSKNRHLDIIESALHLLYPEDQLFFTKYIDAISYGDISEKINRLEGLITEATVYEDTFKSFNQLTPENMAGNIIFIDDNEANQLSVDHALYKRFYFIDAQTASFLEEARACMLGQVFVKSITGQFNCLHNFHKPIRKASAESSKSTQVANSTQHSFF